MVLIMSRDNDYSTIQITQWLKYFGMPFIRINQEDSYKITKIEIGDKIDFELCSNLGLNIFFSNIKSVWYRRGHLNFIYNLNCDIPLDLRQYSKIHLIDELKILEEYFYFLMNELPHLGSFQTRGMNKLEVLYKAKQIGITIPKTSVVDSSDYLDKSQSTITKNISESYMPHTSYGGYITYTEDVNVEFLTQQKFFPSLFQEKHEKEADIRIFYIDGKFYSMAIRSQENEQTATDFRKYLKQNPNRKFPFKLSIDLESKLSKLMRELNLETGSIDMILTKNGKFIFLEVNPIGQFGMTSYPCNYYLEKIIAKHLIKISENEK